MRLLAKVILFVFFVVNIAYAASFALAWLRGVTPDDLGGQLVLHLSAALILFVLMLRVDSEA